MWGQLRTLLLALRLSLPKIGVGWMFALLTIDFNRIAIVELGIATIIVTSLLSVHYLISPFQVVIGRFADLHPIGGYRRTPYLLVASVLASILFVVLPIAVHAMSVGSLTWSLGIVILFVVFGFCMATIGDAHHAMIAEATTQKNRGAVIAVVWIIMIMSTIASAVLMNKIRPVYSPEAMQFLYNLTPPIVIVFTLLGILGIERRLGPAEARARAEQARAATPPGNPLKVALKMLRTDRETCSFFFFIFIAIFAIFLQDNILEVFGAEVFGMTVSETTHFQPMWGGGVLIGMIVMGIASVIMPISKRTIVILGCIGTAIFMSSLAMTSVMGERQWVLPSLIAIGFFTGVFNVGALSLMMEMTVPEATGLYMGLWGTSQTMAQGAASVGSGFLHSALIDSGVMEPAGAYGLIFGSEAVGLLIAAVLVLKVSSRRFQQTRMTPLSHADLTRAMGASAAS